MKNSATITPTTLAGIKSLATDIKRQQGITHTNALNLASEQAGFQNFAHASKQLLNISRQYELYLTAYWYDTTLKTGGRETLQIQLSQPWAELILPAQLSRCRGLQNFKGVAPDHMILSRQMRWADAQSIVRRRICAAARAMTFIDATKLRPTSPNVS